MVPIQPVAENRVTNGSKMQAKLMCAACDRAKAKMGSGGGLTGNLPSGFSGLTGVTVYSTARALFPATADWQVNPSRQDLWSALNDCVVFLGDRPRLELLAERGLRVWLARKDKKAGRIHIQPVNG